MLKDLDRMSQYSLATAYGRLFKLPVSVPVLQSRGLMVAASYHLNGLYQTNGYVNFVFPQLENKPKHQGGWEASLPFRLHCSPHIAWKASNCVFNTMIRCGATFEIGQLKAEYWKWQLDLLFLGLKMTGLELSCPYGITRLGAQLSFFSFEKPEKIKEIILWSVFLKVGEVEQTGSVFELLQDAQTIHQYHQLCKKEYIADSVKINQVPQQEDETSASIILENLMTELSSEAELRAQEDVAWDYSSPVCFSFGLENRSEPSILELLARIRMVSSPATEAQSTPMTQPIGPSEFEMPESIHIQDTTIGRTVETSHAAHEHAPAQEQQAAFQAQANLTTILPPLPSALPTIHLLNLAERCQSDDSFEPELSSDEKELSEVFQDTLSEADINAELKLMREPFLKIQSIAPFWELLTELEQALNKLSNLGTSIDQKIKDLELSTWNGWQAIKAEAEIAEQNLLNFEKLANEHRVFYLSLLDEEASSKEAEVWENFLNKQFEFRNKLHTLRLLPCPQPARARIQDFLDRFFELKLEMFQAREEAVKMFQTAQKLEPNNHRRWGLLTYQRWVMEQQLQFTENLLPDELLELDVIAEKFKEGSFANRILRIEESLQNLISLANEERIQIINPFMLEYQKASEYFTQLQLKLTEDLRLQQEQVLEEFNLRLHRCRAELSDLFNLYAWGWPQIHPSLHGLLQVPYPLRLQLLPYLYPKV